MAHDNVNHPKHYNNVPGGVECIEIARLLNFDLGNAFKYVYRCRDKNGVEDLQKSMWYLQDEINNPTFRKLGKKSIGIFLYLRNKLLDAIEGQEEFSLLGLVLLDICDYVMHKSGHTAVVDYPSPSYKKQPAQFLKDAITTIADKIEEMVVEEAVNSIPVPPKNPAAPKKKKK